MEKFNRGIIEQSHRIGVQFLIADLSAALTFLDVAEVTASDDVRLRNREHARTAYDTVRRLLPKVIPSEEERLALESKFNELKRRLLGLGFGAADLE